jgi:hypothetical protein
MNDEPSEGDRKPEYAGNVPCNACPPPSTEEEGQNSKNRDHQRAERDHWAHEKWVNKVTLLIAGIALTAAIASAFISNQALRAAIKASNEATRQADAAFADQRPWLRINMNLIGFRFLENTDAEITYDITTKNVGRSPARNIRSRMGGGVVTKDNAIDSIPDQKRQCDLAQRDAELAASPGTILFAGETATGETGMIGLAGIGKMTITYGEYISGWPRADYFQLRIVGCFDYTLPSEEHGQTGFAYTLMKRVGDNAPGAFSPLPGIISVQDIFFRRAPFSGGYFR